MAFPHSTARVYNGGKSEELLGAVEAHKTYTIATKAPAFSSGSLRYDAIVDNCNKSLQALKQDKIDLYYLHGPDRATPLEEQCRAIGQLHKEGKIERFGVSNISDEEVQNIHDYCREMGFVLPTVYQGGFNPLLQGSKKTLLPLLRKLNMAFYAYSPLAGGLLAKNIDEVLKPAEGSRFQAMPVFGTLYLKDGILSELRKLTDLCQQSGITTLEATLRWFRHHSPLQEEDGVIIGASSDAQLQASLAACEKGPLPEEIQQAFVTLWASIEHLAPGYHV